LKRRHHEWSEHDGLEVSRLGARARIIRTRDGEPQNEDRLTFYDPFEGRVLSGTVRLSTGYFDPEADGMMYRITLDLDR
jgi:hypothetical protein